MEESLMAEHRCAPEQNQTPKHAAPAYFRGEHARIRNGEDALFSVPLSEVRHGGEATSRTSRSARCLHRASSGELLRGAGSLTHAASSRAKYRVAAFVTCAFVLVVACSFTWGQRGSSSGQAGEVAQTQETEQAADESANLQEASQTQEQDSISPGQTPDASQDFAHHRRSALGSMEQGDMPHSPHADFMQEAGFPSLMGISAHVPELFQYPSMPAGCEVYSLAAVITGLGYDPEPDDLVATYLPFDTVDDDYATAFWGDPYSSGEGMPPAIMIAGNAYLEDAGATERFENATGTSFDDLVNQANSGGPVLVWTTLSFEDPQFDEPLEANSFYYLEHCVVLLGTQGDDVCLMDPTQGFATVSYSWFKYLYEQCGSMALKLA